jgi:prolyl 4-hydroxylase
MFHSMKPDGTLEKRSLHAACPVIKGIKWSAAKWSVFVSSSQCFEHTVPVILVALCV